MMDDTLSLHTFLFSSSFFLMWLFKSSCSATQQPTIIGRAFYYTNLACYVIFQMPVLVIGTILYPFYGPDIVNKLHNVTLFILDKMFLQMTLLNKYPYNKTHFSLSNHTSSSDGYSRYFCPYNGRCIVKKSILYIPFLGQVFWLLGFIFIKRDNKNSRNNTKNLILETINKNVSVQIYPQGTRETNKFFKNNEIVLKKGSIEMAIEANVPIVLSYHNIGDRIDDKNKTIHFNKKVYIVLSNLITLPSEYSDLPMEEKVNKLYKIIYSEFTRLEQIVLDKIRISP